MADAADSKSAEGDLVWVQLPSPAYLGILMNNQGPYFFKGRDTYENKNFSVYFNIRSDN